MKTKGSETQNLGRLTPNAETCTTVYTNDSRIKLIEDKVLSVIADAKKQKKRLFGLKPQDIAKEVVKKVVNKFNFQAGSNENCLSPALSEFINNATWSIINRNEANYLIERLKSDSKFSIDFFFGKNPSGFNIARLRSRILGMIANTYQIDMNPLEFNDLLFIHLWSYGTWAMLDKFNFDGPIFKWLETIAWREAIHELEKNKLINKPKERTATNTVIDMSKLTPESRELVINECVGQDEYRTLLHRIYVDEEGDDAIMSAYNMTPEEYENRVKKAEKALKDGILRSPYNFDELLRDRTSRFVKVDTESALRGLENMTEASSSSQFSDIFDPGLSKDEIYDRIDDMLNEITNNMDWSDNDKYIWRSCYLAEVTPGDVAINLGVSRHYVDNHYKELSVEFTMALRRWYAKCG